MFDSRYRDSVVSFFTAGVSKFSTSAAGAPKRAADVTITEGGQPVWKGGKFVPGVAGVLSGALSADAKAVDFQVQAGAYAFAVSL